MALGHRGRVLAVVGVILLLVGLAAAWYSSLPAAANETLVIPPDSGGYEYYSEYSFSVLAGGHVEGTFTVVNGTPITVFLFNDADYNSYANGANLSGLYTATAVSGTIRADVPGFNTYHIVFAHAPGYNGTEQDVAVDLTSTGLDPSFALGGTAAIVVGVVFLVIGVRRMRAPAPVAPSGVLPSRATYAPPSPTAGPDTSTSGGGVYRVPPPVPGTPETIPAPAAATAPPTDSGEMPKGTLLVSLTNRSPADRTVTLQVNGQAVSTVTVRAGTTEQASLPVRLATRFGSMVLVEAITPEGRRFREQVFVGAGGMGPVTLSIT